MPGLADPLRSKLSSTQAPGTSNGDATASAPVTSSSHPLEARLKNWGATQEALKMESLRRTFGIAEPVRRGMEMKIVGAGEWRPACLGGSDGVGMDVLRGAEMGSISWEDVFKGTWIPFILRELFLLRSWGFFYLPCLVPFLARFAISCDGSSLLILQETRPLHISRQSTDILVGKMNQVTTFVIHPTSTRRWKANCG